MERAADLIIRTLSEAGADRIFMISGRGILYLTDAAARCEALQTVCTYHEQGASYAAMAYAAAKNGIAVCLVSTGCAAANAVTAALCAYQDGLPVVFLSGNNPLSENSRHTGVPIRTYGSQEADIIPVVSSVTKYAVMLEDPDMISAELEKALYLAQEGRKGPVWIDVPLDIQNAHIDSETQTHFAPPAAAVYDPQAAAAAEALDSAERPVLLIGGGAADCTEEISALSEQYDIPVVFSPAACDVYGAAHPHAIGAVGSIGGSRAGNFAVQNSDLVLAAGTKLCSQLTGAREQFARAARILAVDIDKTEHSKDGVRIERLIHCDAKQFFAALLETGCRTKHSTWMQKCLHWKQLFTIESEDFVRQLRAEDRLDLYTVAAELEAQLPPDAAVITDAGFEELIIPSAIRYKPGQRCLFPKAQGAMGYAIPAIIGAYHAGKQHIVCVVGDGSVMMNIQELGIIAAAGIPAKIFIIRNNMYAVIRKRQHDLFRRRTVGNDPSDGVPAPDFAKLAEGFGIRTHLAENCTQLRALLREIMQSDAPEITLIDTDPEQKYFHESYARNEQGRIVRRPIEDMSPFLDRALLSEEMLIPTLE